MQLETDFLSPLTASGIWNDATDWFAERFTALGLGDAAAEWTGLAALFVVVLLLCAAGYLVTRHLVMRLLAHYIRTNRFQWDNRLLERKVFHRLSHLVPSLILYAAASGFGDYRDLLERLASIYVILTVVRVIHALLNAVDDIYNTYEIARRRPIKGYLQGVMVFAYVIGGILIIARVIDQSPVILLSGIGAMTAVVLLIFQDSILGFVAGIQLASNDMVRIGDWIEMPDHNANGSVFEVTLTTIKVQNFDNTITTIPPQALVRESFRNWRGMVESGARRIMRSVFIDAGSIRFCAPEMLERFSSIRYLEDYIAERTEEIAAWNREHGMSENPEPVNGRRMTNIGTFRAYLQRYLAHHPGIRQDLTLMVRLLPPGEHGVPMELYAFAATTDWVAYEGIQADLMDHLLAVAPRFGLRIYQAPGSQDIRDAIGALQSPEDQGGAQ